MSSTSSDRKDFMSATGTATLLYEYTLNVTGVTE